MIHKAGFTDILFLGQTIGGDVGANIYVHINNNEIDSLIIDNTYCFIDYIDNTDWIRGSV
jgi:hypothetical protein